MQTTKTTPTATAPKTAGGTERPARLFRTRRVSRRSFDRFVARATKSIKAKRRREQAEVRSFWGFKTVTLEPRRKAKVEALALAVVASARALEQGERRLAASQRRRLVWERGHLRARIA